MVARPNTIIHLIFLVTTILWSLWYLYDSYLESSHFTNVGFISAAVFVVLASSGVIIFALVRRQEQHIVFGTHDKRFEKDEGDVDDVRLPIILVGFFGVYVLSLIALPFDFATFIFIYAMIAIQRRVSHLRVVLFAAVFSVISTFMLSLISTYPIHSVLNIMGWT